MGEPSIILFPHPGAEHHSTRAGELYPWNRKPKDHRRKFLRGTIRPAVRERDAWRLDDRQLSAAMWTEYEAPTRIRSFAEARQHGLSRAWHEFVPVGAVPSYAHGTDPWVFGDAFRYATCKQDSMPDLQRLQKGDVIFFGSWMERDELGHKTSCYNFFLDTVFVVDQGYPVGPTLAPVPEDLIDPAFARCAWERIGRPDRRTLYRGAMLGSRASREPFSWVPCLPAPAGSAPPRFRRPMIGQLFGMTSGHGQRIPRVERMTPAEAWAAVTKHCVAQGLSLAAGVQAPALEAVPQGPVATGSCA